VSLSNDWVDCNSTVIVLNNVPGMLSGYFLDVADGDPIGLNNPFEWYYSGGAFRFAKQSRNVFLVETNVHHQEAGIFAASLQRCPTSICHPFLHTCQARLPVADYYDCPMDAPRCHLLSNTTNLDTPRDSDAIVRSMFVNFFDSITGAATTSADQIANAPFPGLGASFSTPSDGLSSLTSVTLKLTLPGPADQRILNVSLFSDHNTSIGTKILDIGVIPEPSLVLGDQIVKLSLTLPFPLDSGARYWLVLTSLNSIVGWDYTSKISQPSVSGEFFASNGIFANSATNSADMMTVGGVFVEVVMAE